MTIDITPVKVIAIEAELFFEGRPQLGHIFALLEYCFPHSGHLIKDTFLPPNLVQKYIILLFLHFPEYLSQTWKQYSYENITGKSHGYKKSFPPSGINSDRNSKIHSRRHRGWEEKSTDGHDGGTGQRPKGENIRPLRLPIQMMMRLA